MKHALYCLLVVLPALAYGGAPAPCAKDADACADTGPRSAFLEAAKAPGKPKAAAPSEKAAKKSAPAPAPENYNVAASPPVDAPPPAAPGPSSNPLWVVFAAGGLAGLYLYLKNDAVKKKRK